MAQKQGKNGKKRLTAELKEKFDLINIVGKQSDEHKKYFSQDRVVVDVDIILNMFQVCQLKTCLANGDVKSWHMTGGVLHITWTCENGHSDQCYYVRGEGTEGVCKYNAHGYSCFKYWPKL